MAVYQLPVRQRARVEVSGYPPEKMRDISNAVVVSLKDRISQALDVNDSPAPPLKTPSGRWQNAAYAKRKVKAGKRPVRDWDFTGRLKAAMKTLDAGYNRAVIGFEDTTASTTRSIKSSLGFTAIYRLLPPSVLAAINNRRSRQFGISSINRLAMNAALSAAGPPVQVVSK